MSGTISIGTSGWHYKHWIGPFYPKGLPQNEMLSFYAERFHTVEINNSFYRLPETKTFTNWSKEVPEDFLFAVKASRFITHMKKLKAPKTSTSKLFNRIGGLGEKLGPILFQLPPRWHLDHIRLAQFLNAMTPGNRYVFEFRDPSWLTDQVYELLKRHNAAFCIHDFGGQETPRQITADFTYVRFHGTGEAAYTGSYPLRILKAWAKQIEDWLKNLSAVYVYFNNDFQAHAIRNALTLRELMRDREILERPGTVASRCSH